MITVCRQSACPGGQTAARAAKTLRFRQVDQEIVHRAREEAGVPKIASLVLVYQGRTDLLERVAGHDLVTNALKPPPSVAAERICRPCGAFPTRNHD